MYGLLFVKENFAGSGTGVVALRWGFPPPVPYTPTSIKLVGRLDSINVQGAILDCTCIVNVVDTNSDTLCATCFGDEDIFDSTDFKHTHLVRSDSGRFSVVVYNCLTRQGRSKLHRVGREERLLWDNEVRFGFIHNGSIHQMWSDVKG